MIVCKNHVTLWSTMGNVVQDHKTASKNSSDTMCSCENTHKTREEPRYTVGQGVQMPGGRNWLGSRQGNISMHFARAKKCCFGSKIFLVPKFSSILVTKYCLLALKQSWGGGGAGEGE